jgi:two-component system, chemotaxis family, response regulator WspF
VKIGIVTNVAAAAEALRRTVDLAPEHRVIWFAATGAEAVNLCSTRTPDLVLLDLMAALDGVETTRRIMATTPCPILLIATSVRVNAAQIFEAMGYGAVDAADAPVLKIGGLKETAAPLLEKIELLSQLIGGRSSAEPSSRSRSGSLIAVGASAGGPAVLATMLRGLPKDFPAAIVIVQHVDEHFAAGMAEWLNQVSALPVRVAREGDRPAPMSVLLASTRDHLIFKSADRLGYTVEPSENVYRPSVDVFFQSVCRLWRGDVVGVLLTGMGRDGAIGLKALRDRGYHTIAQDEATCAVYGMPKAAAALNAAVEIVPGPRVASKLLEALCPR